MSQNRKKVATQVVLSRGILRDCKRSSEAEASAGGAPPLRPHVVAAYLGSHEKYGDLYKKLAK